MSVSKLSELLELVQKSAPVEKAVAPKQKTIEVNGARVPGILSLIFGKVPDRE